MKSGLFILVYFVHLVGHYCEKILMLSPISTFSQVNVKKHRHSRFALTGCKGNSNGDILVAWELTRLGGTWGDINRVDGTAFGS